MKGRYTIGVLVAVFLWSLSFIWTKETLNYLSPTMLVAFRVFIAAILVTGYAKFVGRLEKLDRKDFFMFLVLSCAEPVGYFLFETNGMTHVTPTLAGVIIALIPIFSPVLAYFVNGERAQGRVWIGLGISMIGVMIVIFADGLDELTGRLIGVMLLFGAVVMAMIYSVIVQRLAKKFNSFSIVAWQNVFSLIILIPILLVLDFDRLSVLQFSWDWLSGLLALGVLCSSVAFILYADGIREFGVAKTSIFNNLMPGITAVASYFIIGETIGSLKIIGLLVTILGLFVGNMKATTSGQSIAE